MNLHIRPFSPDDMEEVIISYASCSCVSLI
jgi:hypothetical protein